MTRSTSSRTRSVVLGACSVAALAIGAVSFDLPSAFASEKSQLLPAPAVDGPAPGGRLETAVLAGGCFWGVQGVFQHLKGVTRAVSGYAGGQAADATYDAVSSGRTGHAEAVSVTYDPAQISYGEILRVFFSVALDPTEVNRQGPDSGTQYRSAIFPLSDGQAAVAMAYIAQLDAAHVFRRRVATTIEPAATFHAAESYHQDFLSLNPTYPYIVVNDLPKVRDLQRFFPERFVTEPVLVRAGGQKTSRS